MSFRHLACSAAVLALFPGIAHSQSADEQAVLTVVRTMFDGMRSADSAAVRAVFAPGARFASVNARGGAAAIEYDTVDSWIRAIANSNRRWDEQLYDVQVKVDGNMALVWAPYTFYLDKAVRHCGVDAIALLKGASGWRVTQLSDTQRRENCPDPLRTASADASGEAARAVVISMKSFLRNLVAIEERFYAGNSRYTDKASDLPSMQLPQGVTLKSLTLIPGAQGWTAIVVSERLSNVQCGIAVNTTNPLIASAGEGEPACR